MILIPNTSKIMKIFSPIFIYVFFSLSLRSCSLAMNTCQPFSCNSKRQDTIQFPFHVPDNQTSRCGYPGFDLTCGRNGQTFLNHNTKSLIVRGINYPEQYLIVSDPNSCIPNLVLNQNTSLTSLTPYNYGPYGMTYSFLNCSHTNISTVNPDVLPIGTSVVACLSGGDYTIMTTFLKESEEEMVREAKCKVIKRVITAFWWPEVSQGFYPADMSDAFLRLSWDIPSCGDCFVRGGSCGFASDGVNDVVCLLPPSSGLSKGAKYGLMLGIGIPAILCMIVLTYYISSRGRVWSSQNQSRRYPNTEFSPAIFPQPVIVTVGLDRPTIESYPKTILGESKRLPKTSDNICPICLSEYQPKETLREIPECNHYFHADCIDEWLRMNATCPLCRKSPQQQSSAVDAGS